MEITDPILTISGTVEDVRTNEPIVDANIYLKSDRTNSTFSNIQGYFSLEVDLATYEPADILIVTSAGYERFRQRVQLNASGLSVSVRLSKRIDKTDRSQSDVELVAAALSGEQRAYGKLMERYRDSIFFMVQKMINNREDADDITMESFGKAFSSLDKYNSDYAFSTWLYRIAINNCIDFSRKKRIDIISIDNPNDDNEGNKKPQDYETDALDPEENYMKQQRVLMMQNVLSQINSKYRKLIEMRYLQELSYDEIAEKLDMPLGTVKAQLFRAKDLLSNILNKTKDNY